MTSPDTQFMSLEGFLINLIHLFTYCYVHSVNKGIY